MKIIDNCNGEYSVYNDGRSVLSKFNVDFVRKFWELSPMLRDRLSQEEYYNINRALTDTVQKMVGILQVKHKIHREQVEYYSEEMIVDSISRLLADQIMSHEGTIIGKDIGLMGEHKYKCEIPIIFKERL